MYIFRGDMENAAQCFEKVKSLLRIRDVYPGSRIRIFSIPDPGSRVETIPDSGSISRSASKNLSVLTKKLFLSSRKYDPGCSSRIRILIFSPSQIPDPGIKKARIPDPDTQQWLPYWSALARIYFRYPAIDADQHNTDTFDENVLLFCWMLCAGVEGPAR